MPPPASPSTLISRAQNLTNLAWLIVIGIPPLVFGYYFTHHCQPSLISFNAQNEDVWYMDKLSMWENTCRFGGQHPLLMVNVLMFVFMDVFFWLASLAQDSTWLIDPFWTIIPLLIAQFYWIHPLANGDPVRAWAVMGLLWFWSARLTYSYFRREEWQFGAREDWRFMELRRKNPQTWWWSSFFLAYASQHLFLFGITLPLYPAFHDPRPGSFGLTDAFYIAVSLFGIMLASHSDTVLREFMQANEARELRGEQKVLLLEKGAWAFSRHPNYVGEQLNWWGLGLLAAHQGHAWMLAGPFLNSVCLAVATGMVEERMLRNEARREIYKQYCKRVSCWIPFKRMPDAIKAMIGGSAAVPAARQQRHRQ